ncbi:putative alpha-glucosidase [Platanthera guangdongensis]|uniref:Alpha-glucosidase n=1 Tax=Platanthera guangdongensis TaxID=2320717 RepID=A0ABR2MZY8_9ASPA
MRQELYLWKSVAESAKKALGLRYRLLPYYYTQMFYAHKSGTPIARPLFFSFPEDPHTYGINTQFLIGDALLVSPVLQPGATSVEAYFPKGRWFNLFHYAEIIEAPSGQEITIQAPSDTINVHARGGSIFVLQNTTTASLTTRTSLEILAVLDEEGNATGEVFVDDGEVVEMGGDVSEWTIIRFTCRIEGGKAHVRAAVVNGTYWTDKLVVEKVVILGLNSGSTSALPTVHIENQLISAGKVLAGKASSSSRGRFDSVEITGLSQSILEKFHIRIDLV